MEQDHLMEKVLSELWFLESSLEGLAALFMQSGESKTFSADELAGIGQLLKGFAREISRLEDMIKDNE